MERRDKFGYIVLAIIIAIAAFLGVTTGNYLVTGMYILTLLAVVSISKTEDVYNLLYAVLLVSAVYDYTLYVPGIDKIYMFHIVLAIFTVLSLYRAFKDRDVLLNIDKKIIAMYAIWFVYMCASVVWALSRGLAIKYIAIYLIMFAFIIDMMIYNINKERLKNTMNILLFLISLIVVIGFVEVLLGQQLPVKHYIDGFKDTLPEWQINTIQARPIVFSYNTNNLTATLAMMIPICLFAIYKFENVLAKIWFTIISCAAFSLVVITTSRTGYTAFLVGVAAFAIYSIVNIRKLGLKQMIFPVVIIAGFTLAYFYSPMLMHIKPVGDVKIQNSTSLSGKLHSLEDMTDGEITQEGSALHRMEIIKDVYNGVIGNKHFQGYGVGNVEQFLKDQGNTGAIYSPHCYVIEILGDFGLPGIVLYGIYYLYLLIGNLVIAIKKKSLMCLMAAAGLIAFAPASFGPSSITYVFSYWILIGFAVSCMQVNKRSDDGYRPTSSLKEFRMN